MFRCSSRKPGVINHRIKVKCEEEDSNTDREIMEVNGSVEKNPFLVGDKVYLRPRSGKCNVEWSGPHIVTGIESSVAVVLNDEEIPRHVSHIRLVPGQSRPQIEEADQVSEIDPMIEVDSDDGGDDDGSIASRLTRPRKPPLWHSDYVMG